MTGRWSCCHSRSSGVAATVVAATATATTATADSPYPRPTCVCTRGTRYRGDSLENLRAPASPANLVGHTAWLPLYSSMPGTSILSGTRQQPPDKLCCVDWSISHPRAMFRIILLPQTFLIAIDQLFIKIYTNSHQSPYSYHTYGNNIYLLEKYNFLHAINLFALIKIYSYTATIYFKIK